MPQETIAQVRAMLQERGLPLTTENLNRGMLALAQQQPQQLDGIMSQVDAQVNAAPTAPPRARSNAPRGTVTTDDASGGTYRPDASSNAQAASDITDATGANERRAITGPTNMAAIEQPPEDGTNMREEGNRRPPRAGTANGATRINEDDPTAGMFAGQPMRQANEEGVNQVALAAALGLPLTMVLPGMLPARVASSGSAPYTAMQQFQRQRAVDLVRQNPARGATASAPPPVAAAPAPATMPGSAGVGGQGQLIANPARPLPMATPRGPQIGTPPGQQMVAGPPAPVAAPATSAASEASTAARSMAGSPAQSPSRLNTGPQRGQQATGDANPNAAPGRNATRPLPREWSRNEPRSLREQLAMRRREADARGKRVSGR